jgi:serine O-acetyltransferase
MIHSKAEYYHYLECDRKAQSGKIGFMRYLKDDIWKFIRILRKAEYYKNCRKDIIGKIYYYTNIKMRLRKLSYKLGFTIPENVFEEGLSIAHYGNIVINPHVKIGRNCRIHVGVNIGLGARGELPPVVGNNVYIGPGAKLFGSIIIGDNTVIGANAVVNKSFPEGNISLGGIPAKEISKKNSNDIIKW